MWKAVSIFLSILAVNLAVEECGLMPSNIKDFKIDDFLGVWYNVYHTSNEYVSKYKCFIEEYHKAQEGGVGYAATSSVEDISTGKRRFSTTMIEPLMDGVKITYDDMPEFNAEYHVYATDYNNYLIMGGCPLSFTKSLYMWISFRCTQPDKEVVDAAFKAAEDAGLDVSKFIKAC